MSGKIKMFSQSVATALFFLLILTRDWMTAATGGSPVSEDFLRTFAFCLACFTVAVTWWSMIEYFRDVPELIAEYTSDASPGKDGDGRS
jgi:phosphatidylglycerophosphate synthase